jgi:VIT1/CCC1 family predicted Fe2+/Mn2+ transporter
VSVPVEEQQERRQHRPRSGWRRVLEHYVRDVVFAANDGVVTTFAVVAGVRGAKLGAITVLALGFANLVADGLSMAVGNYLGIKSERATKLGSQFHESAESLHAARHAAVTWISFAAAGVVPLLPYLARLSAGPAFWTSVALVALTLFGVGAARTIVTRQPMWRNGLEMLAIGAVAGGFAFLAGWVVESLAK